MPLYDFVCRSCGEPFEARTAVDELPACPACGEPGAERLLTGFAGPFTVGLRGAAAKRSNSLRQAREEQHREERVRRRNEAARRGPAKDRPGPRQADETPRRPDQT
ncbi:MAG: FmdB family zinc ribbon protein [Solirubrobacteraceae bacterium]